MNKTFFIIGFIVIVVIFIFQSGLKPSSPDLSSKKRPSDTQKPSKLIENDKLILVKNIKLDYLKQAIEQFCNIYNQETYIAQPRLFLLNNKFVITFPYDIDFERYCYFINYLVNAHDLSLKSDYKPDVKGWYSTETGDAWMREDLVNKKVMIFIPDWDEEHDNVYLTTKDNIGYKMGFAIGHTSQKLDRPVKRFEENPIELTKLTDRETIDFE
ncbi:hypothetical protein [Winogradskyella ouciana]|uniref:hypothetical protein n=1 Tax=Winogradskyella ouciana TaxID=2608631 RepID=UPI003D269AA8